MSETMNTGVTRETFNYKMEVLEVRMDQIENKMSRKADEVVSMQILQHRRELEDILETVEALDKQMRTIDERLNKFVNRLKATNQDGMDINSNTAMFST